MEWYKVHITNDEIVKGKHHQLEGQFQGLFFSQGAPETMALFSTFISPGRDEGVYFYFSPGSVEFAESLIESFGAVPCEKPLKDDVFLLTGQENALETFFPDE